MLLSGRAAVGFASMASLLFPALAARAEPTRAERPPCEPPVIHRHATRIPANAPGFLVDDGRGGHVLSVRVSRLDTRATVPVTRVDDFVRFGGPLEPHTTLLIDLEHDCAFAPNPANYSLEVLPEVPAPKSLGALHVGGQIEGLVPVGGVDGARIDPNGWEPVGVFRETVLNAPPDVLTYDALLEVSFVYDGHQDAPAAPEEGRVDDRYRSVVHARCDEGSRSLGIGTGRHRVEVIGKFAGLDLELRAGPADVALECTANARAAVERHKRAISLRPWNEIWRWLRGIRQDTFAVIVLVSFTVALVRWKRKRTKGWPFAVD